MNRWASDPHAFEAVDERAAAPEFGRAPAHALSGDSHCLMRIVGFHFGKPSKPAIPAAQVAQRVASHGCLLPVVFVLKSRVALSGERSRGWVVPAPQRHILKR